MESIQKWADKIYEETDFGKSISVSISGVIGLLIYLWQNDWVVAAFSAIISFPLFRILASFLHSIYLRRRVAQNEIDSAVKIYSSFCDDELDIVRQFVAAGGCVLTWSQINKLPISSASIESLIQRGVLHTSVTADGMRETFVLDTKIFDLGVRDSKTEKSP